MRVVPRQKNHTIWAKWLYSGATVRQGGGRADGRSREGSWRKDKEIVREEKNQERGELLPLLSREMIVGTYVEIRRGLGME